MVSKEFNRQLIEEYDIEVKGSTLHINDAHPFPEKIEYNDDDSMNIMATKAFETAEGFYHLIKNNCNISEPSILSDARLDMYLALSGLACEIYMKGIIYYEKKHGGKQCRGHKLNDLFLLLPDAYKDEIKQKIEEIEEILPNVGDVFESLRYDYELNRIQGDYLLIFDLMELLHTICDRFLKRAVGEVRYANGTLFLK